MSTTDEATVSTSETPKPDNEIVRLLARAMLSVSLSDESDAEARKAAREENKKEAFANARKVIRRLKQSGVTLVKSE